MNWLKYKRARGQNYVEQGLSSMISRAENLANQHGVKAVIDAIERAMANNWQGWDHAVGVREVAHKNGQKPRGRVRLSDDNG